MKCPSCGLINPETAGRCDCGYDFDTEASERSYLSDAERQRMLEEPAWSNLSRGFGFGVFLYGRRRLQDLEGEEAAHAERTGYAPQTYQAVKWAVALFMPLLPLGVYRIIRPKADHPFSGSIMHAVPWDWKQVLLHYLVAWGLMGTAIWLVWWFALRIH